MSMVRLTQHVSYAPLFFLVCIVLQLIVDTTSSLWVSVHTLRLVGVGGLLIFIAPLLLIWAHDHRIDTNTDHIDGEHEHGLGCGPYAYSRHPKYVAFMMMLLGFGLILNSWAALVVTLIAFLVFTFAIIPKQESYLRDHYGEAFNVYKKKVRMWV